MSCICESTWRALCAIKDAITAPCSSGDDDLPLAPSSNNSNVSVASSNIILDDQTIDGDLGLNNSGFDNDSFTATALEENPATNWRPVLRLRDPVSDEPHTDSGHWTNPNMFTDVDLGDGGVVEAADAPGVSIANKQRTDSRSTTRESGYGRSLDDSNASSSPEPSVSVEYHAPPNPGVSTGSLTVGYSSKNV